MHNAVYSEILLIVFITWCAFLSDLKLHFDNQFINHFTADPIADNYPRLVQYAFSYVAPKQTRRAKLVALSHELATSLGFSEQNVTSEDFIALVSGNLVLAGMQPYAMCYGGHQFGRWADQLGDGRAINLAEIKTPSEQHFTLQLKGAGPTPYSRTADGLAVLRSSVREFLCSEAMFHLGIATTRALSLSLTGDNVVRDMFYDGNAKQEQGAVVCRVSSSFMRFGSFQLPAMRKDITLLKQLVEYSISRDFPHLKELGGNSYLHWFNEICQRNCRLVIHWMRVGFVHGVLNTDNMSIIGETIDYGPYGWIDDFNLHWTPNTTDAGGKRYRFGAQASIVQWNLFQLANAIYPLFDDAEPLQSALDDFAVQYRQQWHEMMASKLGLSVNEKYYPQDNQLFIDLEKLLSSVETDMTIFYRLLAKLPDEESTWLQHFMSSYYNESQLDENYQQQFYAWLNAYKSRRNQEQKLPEDIIKQMNLVNPKFVLRNYLAQQAIELAEQGDYSQIHLLQHVLSKPYDEQPEFEKLAQKRPDWAKNKAGCSMLSCSS